MPEEPQSPQDQPEPPLHSRTGEIIREARKTGSWLTTLSTDKLQAMMLAAITLFVCVLAGWIIYRWDASNEADKTRSEKQLEAIMRENNSQAELIRQHCSTEIEKSRSANASNIKMIQEALLKSIADERDKDRAHEMERDREWFKQSMAVQNAWAAFAIKFADLERAIRGKLKEDEPLTIAPNPREKINVP